MKNKKISLFSTGLVKINNSKNKSAILFLHGFRAEPLVFKELFSYFSKNEILNKYNFYAPTQIHSKESAYNFKQKYSDWLYFVDLYYNELKKKYENVIIVGHSLGGALAFNYCFFKKIPKVILISTPMKVDLKLLFCRNSNSISSPFYMKLEVLKLINRNKKLYPIFEDQLLYFLGLEDKIISKNTIKYLKNKKNKYLYLKTITFKSAKHKDIIRSPKYIKNISDKISTFLK
jgi:esterase/lipase